MFKWVPRDTPRATYLRYGVAILSVLLATATRSSIHPMVGTSFPFATYFLAVMFTAWYGGLGPSLLALALGMATAAYFFIAELDPTALGGTENLLGLTLYAAVGFGLALLGESSHRATRRARQNALAIARSQELLSATLNSIGDAVIVTDTTGRVTFLNPVAETLTGWGQKEARGQPLADVFRVVDEETRAPVESPVTRVLREGRVVGLASRTRLVSRAGAMTPIDDSGAPIKDGSGNVSGVVLIFRDATEQKRVEETMRASEERFSKAFRASPIPMSIVTYRDGRYLDVNDSFLRNSGYTREEIIGRTTTDINLYADPSERARLRRVLEVEGRINNIEVRRRVKSGEVRVALTSSELINLDGELCILTTTNDISERKLAEERLEASLREKELLLKEVHHRVKNNLQIVSSLLNLQSRYLHGRPIAEVFKDSRSRVDSMALLHEILYKSTDLADIDFGKYMKMLASHLSASYGAGLADIRVNIAADYASLDIDTAIPCGLIINELVSNSLKYAFPSGKKGQVDVSLRPNKGDGYVLTVSDDGVGLPAGFDIKTPSSLGLRLVTNLVKQLKGDLEISSGQGTRFKITFAPMKYEKRI
jgi:PAS domain S-box-containing protein